MNDIKRYYLITNYTKNAGETLWFLTGWGTMCTQEKRNARNRSDCRHSGFWWGKVDSNHRSHWQQIYSPESPVLPRVVWC